jgi:hypothetical protein
VARIRRACYSYNGKTRPLFELHRTLDAQSLIVVDYDDITPRKDEWLPRVYRFIDHPYRASYGERIHPKSVNKADRLSNRERALVEELCVPVYQQARALIR